jgi:hypothetical protein
MKGKPIEPGCLALTVGTALPENNGRVVRVVQRAYHGYKIPASPPTNDNPWPADGWIIRIEGDKPPMTGFCRNARGAITARFPTREGVCRQVHLIRLDDDEAPKEVVRTVVKSKPVDEVI